MRELKLQMQLTVNGFAGGPNGELDWMMWDWDDKIKKYVDDLHNTVDSILMGRKMTDGFINYWSNVDPGTSEYPFARKMVDFPKYVFTKTLEKSIWDNTVLVKGDLKEEVNKLKNSSGKDIIVYGGAEFVTNLIAADLIDEYYLFINPSVIKDGLTIFSGFEKLRRLKTTESVRFDCGIILLHYKNK
jgi:dihydrofolate reductase